MKRLSTMLLAGLFVVTASSGMAYDKGRSHTSHRSSTKESTTTSGTSGGNAYDNFSKFDTNHDGYLGRMEWPGDRSIFSKLDKNHDGRLSRAEYTQSN